MPKGQVFKGNQYGNLSAYERFRNKFIINKETHCWEWTGGISSGGYGTFTLKNKIHTASRYSYELYIGEINDELLVCHTCDNRKCVSPFHFFLSTYLDNLIDAQNKGRRLVAVCPSLQMYDKGCRCDGCLQLKRACVSKAMKKWRKNNPDKILLANQKRQEKRLVAKNLKVWKLYNYNYIC